VSFSEVGRLLDKTPCLWHIFCHGENMKKNGSLSQISPTARFDMAREAAQVMQHFSQLRENTVFAVADEETYTPKKPEIFGHWRALLQDKKSGTAKKIIELSIEDGVSYSVRQSENYAEKNNTIVINPYAALSRVSGVVGVPALEHEVGHLVTSTGWDARLNEASADAYMALRMFQRQGEEAVEILSRISAKRAYDFLIRHVNKSYLTVPVIDKIIQDSKIVDFKTLSPEATAALAARYAQEIFPADDAIVCLSAEGENFSKKMKDVLGNPKKHQDIPELLASTILSSPHPLSFHVGAKFFQPFLAAAGSTLEGKKIILADAVRCEAQEIISARAIHFNLQANFPAFDGCENGLSKEPVISKPNTPLKPKTARRNLKP
jgi:hypothetical protein